MKGLYWECARCRLFLVKLSTSEPPNEIEVGMIREWLEKASALDLHDKQLLEVHCSSDGNARAVYVTTIEEFQTIWAHSLDDDGNIVDCRPWYPAFYVGIVHDDGALIAQQEKHECSNDLSRSTRHSLPPP